MTLSRGVGPCDLRKGEKIAVFYVRLCKREAIFFCIVVYGAVKYQIISSAAIKNDE